MFNKKYTKIFSAALFVCWIYISMSSGNNFELKWNIKNCIKSKLTLFSSFLSFLNMGKIKKSWRRMKWNKKNSFLSSNYRLFLYISPPDVIVLVAIRTWWSVCVLFFNSCYFIWFGDVPANSVLTNLLSRAHLKVRVKFSQWIFNRFKTGVKNESSSFIISLEKSSVIRRFFWNTNVSHQTVCKALL